MTVDITRVISSLTLWRTVENMQLSANIAYIYYCLTSIDEEVSQVWPQLRNLGSILYMITKYSMLLFIILDFIREWPLYITMSNYSCHALDYAGTFAVRIAAISIQASFVLCLYALLGAKKRYLYILGTLFTSFFAVGLVLSYLLVIDRDDGSSVSPIRKELGYACSNTLGSSKYLLPWIFTSLARIALAAILATITLFVRFRAQKGRLITTIRRDGALYYVVALSLGLVVAMLNLPGVPPTKIVYYTGNVLNAVSTVLAPLCANRLLLNMRTIADPGTRHIVSTLLFVADTPQNDSNDDGDTVDMHSDLDIPMDTSHKQEKDMESA